MTQYDSLLSNRWDKETPLDLSIAKAQIALVAYLRG